MNLQKNDINRTSKVAEFSRFSFINIVTLALLSATLFLTYIVYSHFLQNTYEITKDLYIASIFFILPIIGIVYRWVGSQQDVFFLPLQKKLWVLWAVIIGFLSSESHFMFFSLNLIFHSAHSFLLLLLGIGWLWYSVKDRPAAGRSIMYGILVVLAIFSVLNLFRLYAVWFHNIDGNFGTVNFNAVFESVIFATQGKLPLVNYYAQYGYYSLFLAWLFRLLPLTLITYSYGMAVLAVSSFVFLFLGLKKTIRNPFIQIAVLLAYLYAFLHATGGFAYWANVPIRFIFPSIIFWLIASYLTTKNRTTYYFIFTLATLSTFWNLDTGAVLFLSWIFFLAYLEWLSRPSLRDCFLPVLKITGTGLLFLIGFYGGYGIVAFLKTGIFPHYSKLFIFQNDFFGKRFASVPMRPFDAWSIAVLVYIAGLVYGFDKKKIQEVQRKQDYAPVVMFLSVMGIGIFSYFVMRSCPTNIFIIIWPAIILVAIGAEAMLVSRRYLVGLSCYFCVDFVGNYCCCSSNNICFKYRSHSEKMVASSATTKGMGCFIGFETSTCDYLV